MKNKYLSIISIVYSILLLYLLISNNIKNYLAKSMFIYIIIASIILLIIGIVSFMNKDNHYKFKMIDLVLLLPLIMFLLSGNGRLTTSLAQNRIINKNNTNITNKSNKVNNPEISIKEDKKEKEENDIYFDVIDESFVTLSDYISFDERAKKYIGKKIRVRGFLVDYETLLPENYYSIGRYAITCCVADANYVGFFFKYDKRINKDNWYEIEGTLEEFKDTKGFEHLAINVTNIKEIDEMSEEQYVYPCYAYDEGKCTEISKYNLD